MEAILLFKAIKKKTMQISSFFILKEERFSSEGMREEEEEKLEKIEW